MDLESLHPKDLRRWPSRTLPALAGPHRQQVPLATVDFRRALVGEGLSGDVVAGQLT